MKIQTIKLAQEIGLHVCSGGIIGMGETFEDNGKIEFTSGASNTITGNMLTTSGNN